MACQGGGKTTITGLKAGLLPLLQRNDGGEGRGRGACLFGLPLSLTLPFVPRGDRESVPGKNILVGHIFFRRKANEKTIPKNFVLRPKNPFSRFALASPGLNF